MRSLSVAALALGLLPLAPWGQAGAAERTPFESVKGWDVERRVGDTSANPCIMSHGYEDAEDNNAANAVVFGLNGSQAILVVVYEKWTWDKEETVKAPLYLDKKAIKTKSAWTGDGTTLRMLLPDTVVPDLLAAKKIIVKFDDGEADFDIANFASGYEALRRCDAAPKPAAKTAGKPTKPAEDSGPSEGRIAVYAVGLTLQKVLNECDFASTGKDRNALAAKMDALKPEMAAIEGEIRSEMAKKKGMDACPTTPEHTAKLQTAMRDFVDLSTDAYAAKLNGPDDKAAAAKP